MAQLAQVQEEYTVSGREEETNRNQHRVNNRVDSIIANESIPINNGSSAPTWLSFLFLRHVLQSCKFQLLHIHKLKWRGDYIEPNLLMYMPTSLLRVENIVKIGFRTKRRNCIQTLRKLSVSCTCLSIRSMCFSSATRSTAEICI